MSGYSTRYRWPTWQSTDSGNIYQLQPTFVSIVEGTVGAIDDRVATLENKGGTTGCGGTLVGADTTFGTQTAPIPLNLSPSTNVRGPVSLSTGGQIIFGAGAAGYYTMTATIRLQGSTTGAAMAVSLLALFKNGAALHDFWPDISVVNAHSWQLAFSNVQVADNDVFTWNFQGGNGLRNIGANSHYSFQRGV